MVKSASTVVLAEKTIPIPSQTVSPTATSDACLSAFAGPAGSLCVGVSVTVAVAVVSERKDALADGSASEKEETTSKPRVPSRSKRL